MTLSTTAKNVHLDAMIGADKDDDAPGTLYIALYNGNPATSGTELTGAGGYARLAVTNNGTNFSAASSGAITNAVDFTFATSTGAYSSSCNYAAIFDAPSGGNGYWSGALGSTITVSASGDTIKFTAGNFTITAS